MAKKRMGLFVFALVSACFSCGGIINAKINTAGDSNRINAEIEKLVLPAQMPEGEYSLAADPRDPDYLPADDEALYTKKQVFKAPESGSYTILDLPLELRWQGAILDSPSVIRERATEIRSPRLKRAPLKIQAEYEGADGGEF